MSSHGHHPHTQGFLHKQAATHTSRRGRAKQRKAKDRRRSQGGSNTPLIETPAHAAMVYLLKRDSFAAQLLHDARPQDAYLPPEWGGIP